MRTKTMRTAVATGALALGLAAPAAAHITADPGEAPADGFATVGFQVPHGCEDSPTTRLRIKIPPSVPSVTPGRNAFWDLATKEGRKDKVELHGETITKGVSEVIYTAKQPLPPHQLDVLPISLKLPAGKAGDSVYFPTIQQCAEGETAWIQIPAEGESGEELESPAPAVVLTAGQGEHGASGTDEAQPEEASAEGEEDAGVQTAGASVEDDEGAPMWLVIVALALGALGALAGIGGLMATRGRAA